MLFILANLAFYVAQAWETNPTQEKVQQLYYMMSNLLDTTSIDKSIPLDEALKKFVSNPAPTPTVCSTLTLLIAISYVERLNKVWFLTKVSIFHLISNTKLYSNIKTWKEQQVVDPVWSWLLTLWHPNIFISVFHWLFMQTIEYPPKWKKWKHQSHHPPLLINTSVQFHFWYHRQMLISPLLRQHQKRLRTKKRISVSQKWNRSFFISYTMIYPSKILHCL